MRGYEFIRIKLDGKDFNERKAMNETYRHIKKSAQKSLIDKILKRLLGLEFKSNQSIK